MELIPFLPFVEIGEDNEGQVIIYTNLYEKPDGTLGSYEEVHPVTT